MINKYKYKVQCLSSRSGRCNSLPVTCWCHEGAGVRGKPGCCGVKNMVNGDITVECEHVGRMVTNAALGIDVLIHCHCSRFGKKTKHETTIYSFKQISILSWNKESVE